jgi:hypothetical protein
MSGFSPGWLSLREPSDHRARNREVRNAAVEAMGRREHVRLVDLACGTGSNLRGLLSYLPERQSWLLVDSDPNLLAVAHEALVAFADDVVCHHPLIFLKRGRHLDVSFARLDLKSQLAEALDGTIDLVTTAAFFDLVSSDWIERFCKELSSRNLPLYSILNYSGEEVWHPSHRADEAMLAAFHRHQASDKGFGPAAGPKGASILQRIIQEHGYRVSTGSSAWRLGEKDAPLIAALADGLAKAVSETKLVPQAIIADWRTARLGTNECEVGHVDLFAVSSAIAVRAPTMGPER